MVSSCCSVKKPATLWAALLSAVASGPTGAASGDLAVAIALVIARSFDSEVDSVAD